MERRLRIIPASSCREGGGGEGNEGNEGREEDVQ
jgi:hypothetical protein